MAFRRAMLLCLLLTCAVALPRHPLNNNAAASSAWHETGRAPSQLLVSLKFIVPHEKNPPRKAALEELFWQVSDPAHAKHAQYVGRDELNSKYLSPSRESHDALHAFCVAAEFVAVRT